MEGAPENTRQNNGPGPQNPQARDSGPARASVYACSAMVSLCISASCKMEINLKMQSVSLAKFTAQGHFCCSWHPSQSLLFMDLLSFSNLPTWTLSPRGRLCPSCSGLCALRSGYLSLAPYYMVLLLCAQCSPSALLYSPTNSLPFSLKNQSPMRTHGPHLDTWTRTWNWRCLVSFCWIYKLGQLVLRKSSCLIPTQIFHLFYLFSFSGLAVLTTFLPVFFSVLHKNRTNRKFYLYICMCVCVYIYIYKYISLFIYIYKYV